MSDSALELVSGCFRALSDPTRLRILRSLKGSEKTVRELVALCGWSQPNISRHLAILLRAGLVKKSKRGAHVHYRIANPRIFRLCDSVCRHVQRRLDGYRGT